MSVIETVSKCLEEEDVRTPNHEQKAVCTSKAKEQTKSSLLRQIKKELLYLNR
jgi:hypothetical protein